LNAACLDYSIHFSFNLQCTTPPPPDRFARRLHKMVRRLAPDCDVRFLCSEDGSGKGAAMVTAVAQRLAAQHAERQRILNPLRLGREQLLEVKRRLEGAMRRGLAQETHEQASVKMLPTYVRATPDGTGEHGRRPPWVALHADLRSTTAPPQHGLTDTAGVMIEA